MGCAGSLKMFRRVDCSSFIGVHDSAYLFGLSSLILPAYRYSNIFKESSIRAWSVATYCMYLVLIRF